jgi:hypothetical protein
MSGPTMPRRQRGTTRRRSPSCGPREAHVDQPSQTQQPLGIEYAFQRRSISDFDSLCGESLNGSEQRALPAAVR